MQDTYRQQTESNVSFQWKYSTVCILNTLGIHETALLVSCQHKRAIGGCCVSQYKGVIAELQHTSSATQDTSETRFLRRIRTCNKYFLLAMRNINAILTETKKIV